jgi:predicted permease
MQTFEALSRVLPVLLLILLGVFLNRKQFIRQGTVNDLKKLVIQVTLPSVLFLAFSRVNLERGHLLIVAIMFAACLLGLILGRLLQPAAGIQSPFFPMLMTGFEAGMLGYAIFGSVYGAENIYKFAIIDLGQVTFVFFVLVTALERLTAGARPFSQTLLSFFKTPVILSILLGVLVNQTGLIQAIDAWSVSASLLRTLELVAALTTPLIALIIGYEIRLAYGGLVKPLTAVVIRLLVWLPAGLLFNALVIERLLHLDLGFQAAVMTMVALPPPFVIPLFMQGAGEQDRVFVVNMLSLATIATLLVFSMISIVYSPG